MILLQSMQAVILAAGRGVRMGKLTENAPKPMLSLFGKPMLEWKLEMLPKTIDEVVLVIGYHGNQIEKYFGERWKGRKISYVVQDELNGTGGALALTVGILKGRFLVIMGDDLYKLEDLNDLLNEDLAMLALHVDDATLFGIVETTPGGQLISVMERPHGKKEALVSTNAFILNQKYFEYPPVRFSPTEYGLPQTLAEMGKEHPVKVVMATAWQPVGCPEDIEKGETFLKKYWLKNI